jgi:hypothetical protein
LSDDEKTPSYIKRPEVALTTTKRDETRRKLFVLAGSSKQIGTSTTRSPNVRLAIP